MATNRRKARHTYHERGLRGGVYTSGGAPRQGEKTRVGRGQRGEVGGAALALSWESFVGSDGATHIRPRPSNFKLKFRARRRVWR